MDNYDYFDPSDFQSEITFARVVIASCAGPGKGHFRK
jgi:hypothetical protein